VKLKEAILKAAVKHNYTIGNQWRRYEYIFIDGVATPVKKALPREQNK